MWGVGCNSWVRDAELGNGVRVRVRIRIRRTGREVEKKEKKTKKIQQRRNVFIQLKINKTKKKVRIFSLVGKF